jgi:type VI secretion system secreted protein Hcp
MADHFLRLDGINGESLDSNHQDEIEIFSWAWDLKNKAPPTLTGQDAAKQTEINHMVIEKFYDKSSVTLVNFCALGKHIPEGQITCRKNNGDQKVEFLTIVLKKIKVESIKWAGRGAEVHGLPETVELSFLKFELHYKTQIASGVLKDQIDFRFDVGTHTEY